MAPDRVSKQRSKAKPKSTDHRDALLFSVLSNPGLVTMPSCSSCEARGLLQCQVSPADSSRCSECVRLNLPRCDVLGLAPDQLRRVATQHMKLEKELEDALEAAEEERREIDARVRRLRKQKKLWFERMMRAVRRGIDNLEDLERVEREEAEKEQKRLDEERPPSADSSPLPVEDSFDFNVFSPDVAMSPSFLADLGFVEHASWSGSGEGPKGSSSSG
jgi:hypothetical protein